MKKISKMPPVFWYFWFGVKKGIQPVQTSNPRIFP